MRAEQKIFFFFYAEMGLLCILEHNVIQNRVRSQIYFDFSEYHPPILI